MTWLRHALQVSEFLFGDGFAISGGDEWRVRRKAVGPSLHKAYLAEMTDRVFGPSALSLCSKLEVLKPLSCLLHGLLFKAGTPASARQAGAECALWHGSASFDTRWTDKTQSACMSQCHRAMLWPDDF